MWRMKSSWGVVLAVQNVVALEKQWTSGFDSEGLTFFGNPSAGGI